METINVLITVDADALANQLKDGKIQKGTQDAPTPLGSYSQSDVYITMISQSGNVINNTQGQSELSIKCNSGDTIQWAITTFTNNFDYSVSLYNGSFSPADAMNPLTYNSSQAKNYLPNSSHILTQYTNQVAVAQAQVAEVNKQITYNLSFQLVNNSTGNIIGYFMWDPFITVS